MADIFDVSESSSCQWATNMTLKNTNDLDINLLIDAIYSIMPVASEQYLDLHGAQAAAALNGNDEAPPGPLGAYPLAPLFQPPDGTPHAEGVGFGAQPAASPAKLSCPKRKQVGTACIHCAKARKGCDNSRPCFRCVKYGIGGTCVDVIKKKTRRMIGVKRGPYKRKNKDRMALNFSDKGVSGDWSQPLAPSASTTAAASQYYHLQLPPTRLCLPNSETGRDGPC